MHPNKPSVGARDTARNEVWSLTFRGLILVVETDRKMENSKAE